MLNIFYQSLKKVEELHKEGYIHCDIKPENILLGVKEDYKRIYLIDFSLSEKYVDEDGEPLEEPAHSVFKGSISFCSRKVLKGQYPSRADDLESLLYSMMYILRGQLPWLPPPGVVFDDPKEKKEYVIKQKKNLKDRDIFIGFPSVFMKIYQQLMLLGYEDTPDYNTLKKLIKDSLCANCNTTKVGEWEPFQSRTVRRLYIHGRLDLKDYTNLENDSVESQVEGEHFVNSFTNFKSYDVDERHGEDSKDTPEKVTAFVCNYGFINKQNEHGYKGLKSLLDKEQKKVSFEPAT